MGIRLHYNPDCPVCERQAARTGRMDWLGRVELCTDESPLGEVPAGNIVVVDKQDNRIFTGIYATRMVCLQVPLLFLYGLILYIPAIRKIAGQDRQGCNGDACAL